MRRVVFIVLTLLLLSGCASMLEGEDVNIVPHVEPSSPPQNTEAVAVADYAQLTDAVRHFAEQRMDEGAVNIFTYVGELDADISALTGDLLSRDAFCAYAIEDIAVTRVQIVSYVRLDFAFTYRRTRAQMSSVLTAETDDELDDALMNVLTDYRSEAAILSPDGGFTPEIVKTRITELYYSNPLKIVMLPVVETVEYPEVPVDGRLIEIQLGYSQSDTVMRAFAGLLDTAAKDVASQATGELAREEAFSLCEILAEIAVHDTPPASLPEYSTLNFAATAYGALLGGAANSEGYAMAYKALCDVLEIKCDVVIGTRDNRKYAWNILSIDEESFHVDPAMSDGEGVSAHFRLTDAEMLERGYSWDAARYPVCNAPE